MCAPARRPPTTRAPAAQRRAVTLAIGFVVTSMAMAAPAHATDVVLAAPASITDVIENLRTWLIGILVALATLFLTIGGVRYLSADGDPGEVERAKRSLRNAAIGYALAALAPLLVSVLQSLVG